MTTWKGVFPAVTTQFKQDQSLDLEATARHLEVLLESGVAGLVMLGSLGENAALEPDEKRQIMQMAIEVSRNRVPVLSGVAENSTSAACRYARDMENLGADGIMLLPAMVYKADARETMTHFRAVARREWTVHHLLQQPPRVWRRHYARNVHGTGRRAEICRHQGIIGQRAPHYGHP